MGFFWGGTTAQPHRETLLNISQKSGIGLSILKGWERSFFQEWTANADLKEIDGVHA